jgi:Xaa-Pro aminopeptidase
MKSHFTSDFFIGNRQRLRELFTGTAPIVITANGLLQRGGDSSFAFAQDASFWYLTGIEEPDVVLVIDRDKEYLIVPARSASREAFDGAVAHDVLTSRSGIKDISDDKSGWELLENRLSKVKHVATVAAAPAYIEPYGIYANPARAALVSRLQAANPEIEVLDVGQHIARLRMIKQPAELSAIQAAIDTTISGLREALKPAKLKGYTYEYEIEAELGRAYRRQGATGHAFEPIVASGRRACTLHNVANSGPLSADELVLVDTGAEVEHYAADLTRVQALGQPSRRQEAVHQAVIDVQRFAIGLLKPGVLLREYEQQVTIYLGEKLRELGLIKTTETENVRQFCPHAMSHFLGLNVHDVGDYNRPLEAGVVLTVEPGIYIPAEGIGVRIEDNVLITEHGNKVLSERLLRDLR